MAVIIGVIYGATAAFIGGKTDEVMMRIVDILYSLQDEEVMDAIAGVEYGSCCWRLRAFVRQGLRPRSSDAGTVGEQDTSFLVQLELRGLGALGSDADEMIDRSLHGFLKSDYLTR